MIVVNQIRCKKCGDTPFSRTVHDFSYCKCGAVAVDGGQEYLRRVGNPDDMEELSYHLDSKIVLACRNAVKDSKEKHKTDLGIAIAVIRELKNSGRLIDDALQFEMKGSL
jgi:hypothetical protein